MQNGITNLILGSDFDPKTFVDISEFKRYNGRGKCRIITLWNDARRKYNKTMKAWAIQNNWEMTIDDPIVGLEFQCV